MTETLRRPEPRLAETANNNIQNFSVPTYNPRGNRFLMYHEDTIRTNPHLTDLNAYGLKQKLQKHHELMHGLRKEGKVAIENANNRIAQLRLENQGDIDHETLNDNNSLISNMRIAINRYQDILDKDDKLFESRYNDDVVDNFLKDCGWVDKLGYDPRNRLLAYYQYRMIDTRKQLIPSIDKVTYATNVKQSEVITARLKNSIDQNYRSPNYGGRFGFQQPKLSSDN